MRSILIHHVDVKPEDVGMVLSDFALEQPGGPWLYPPDADGACLYIEFFTDFRLYTSDDLAALERALGRQPSVSVIADVSGRVPGDHEVRAFVECLLARFHGVAEDDFTPHYWTLAEIRSGATAEGHRFFDYLGWYHAGTRS